MYSKYFFENFLGEDYSNREHWSSFFGKIAKNIVEEFNPKTLLDAGCASGYLVEALRDLGVEAYGIDISEYAVNQSREDIRPYLNVQSITERVPEKFPQRYDMVVTIEVLEHLYPKDGEKGIALLCSYTDTILFTSTPYDIENETHVNVQQKEYWAKLFAENSFYRDLFQPVDFVCGWALLFRKKENVPEVIFNYEIADRIAKIRNSKKTEEREKFEGNVYIDSGNGFTSEHSLTFQYTRSHIDTGKIPINEACAALRIDPVEGKASALKNVSVFCDSGKLKVASTNSNYELDGFYYFDTTDPQFIIDTSGRNILWIELTCDILIFDDNTSFDFVDKLKAEIENESENEKALEKELNEQKEALALRRSEWDRMEADYRTKLAEMEKSYLSDLNELKLEFEKKSRAELLQKQQEIIELVKRHEDEKQKLHDSHYAELENVRKKYEEEYAVAVEQEEDVKEKINELRMHYTEAINQRENYRRQLEHYRNLYNAISDATLWKLTKPVRVVLNVLKRPFKNSLFARGFRCLREHGFKYTWDRIKKRRKLRKSAAKELNNSCSREELERQRKEVFSKNVKFSILVPLYNTPLNFLKEMMQSVLDQTYSNWELCLADGSDGEHSDVRKEVTKISKNDKRIKYKKLQENKGISENTNECIEMSEGDYIVLFDHDDILHPSALYEVMKAICNQNADFVYTDENTFKEKIEDAYFPHFKPDFSPDTLRSYNYICHLTVFKKDLLQKAGGGFRKEFDGSQDYDIVLRLTEVADKVVHIPKILYYWRAHENSVASDISAKPYTLTAAKKALAEHLDRIGIKGMVCDSRIPSTYQIKYEILGKPLVSIIIPNKDHMDDLDKCIRSVVEKSTYRHFEIIIVENNSVEQETFDYYKKIQKKHKNIRVITWRENFNYSKINNFGFRYAKGEHIVLLNNDIEILTPDWLEQMLMYTQRKDVGAAGMMLYYPDDTIQHAGVILGIGGVAGHSHKYFKRGDYGYVSRLTIAQNLSAVTAACMMIRSDVFRQVGGLDEGFAVAFNDVDLCMKIREAGYLIVWTPYAEAYHYESKSRGVEDTPEKQKRFEGEVHRFMDKWGRILEQGDPYYNPNLTLEREDFGIK